MDSDVILIVDDEPLNRELLEAYLELDGYTTVTAGSGLEALRIMDAQKVDLVLLDINMPGMTGFDVLKHMRSHPEHWDLPIIVVTALHAKEDRLKAAELGASDFVSKPIDETELNVRMASLLRMKHAQDAVKRHKTLLENEVTVRTAELVAANERLQALATTDPLTGLANHRAVIAALEAELERCQRFGRTCAILFVDIDHFKAHNDSCGHAVGDAALVTFGEIARTQVRGVDIVGRWGGEEFVIVVPEATREFAMSTAEALRQAVSQAPFGQSGAHLTCSIGVSLYPEDGTTRSELIEAADTAMYAAKSLGRNQVRSFTDPSVASVGRQTDGRDEAQLRGEVAALALLVSIRDCYTGEHTHDVGDLSIAIARGMGMSPKECELVGLVGQLHDVGKVGVPDAVLQKPAALNEEEWVLMRQHPAAGADVVSRMPALRSIASAIRAHHERWDGTGYPDGLAGTDIPIAARIVTVADTYTAITSDRPYRAARSVAYAIEELERGAGRQFDPDVVRVALEVIREWRITGLAA